MKLREAIELLLDAGVPDAAYDAREIFCRYGGFTPATLALGGAESDSEELIRAVERRASREPLQYIIGEVGFFRETYEVSPDCLIPRSDTEILVDYAVRHIPAGERLLDLCCGSGCVGISTLCNTEKTEAVLVDISEGAAAIAERNALRNGVVGRVKILCSDVLETAVAGEYFAVLSNPPYVTESEYEELMSEIYFEPKLAFVGGEDGAVFYRRITELYRDRIADGGFIAFEIGSSMRSLICEIARAASMSCEIIADLSGNDRVAVLRKIH